MVSFQKLVQAHAVLLSLYVYVVMDWILEFHVQQIVFPEIDYDKVDAIRGMDIVICTTAETNEEAYALLEGFNMPFRS